MGAAAGQQKVGSSMEQTSASALNTSLPKIWRSDIDVTIPSADILSFAFANLGQYDQDKPVSCPSPATRSSDCVSHLVRTTPANNSCSRSSSMPSIPHPPSPPAKLESRFASWSEDSKQHGLKHGDCVCIHAFNNVSSFPDWLRCHLV